MTERRIAQTIRPIIVGVLALAGVALFTAPAVAQDRSPLLMDGKTSLFQRVMTRPGARYASAPGDAPAGEAIPPFTVAYVFDRQDVDGTEWVEVAPARRGPVAGWLTADTVINWKQAIVLAFSNPAGRNRTLFFRERDALLDLMESETLVRDAASLRGAIEADHIGPDFPVISIEPATHIDIREQFYLLPILEAEEIYLASGFTSRLLRVASLTKTETPEEDVLQNPEKREVLVRSLADTDAGHLQDFGATIVFIIDSTTSMGPYIEQTREAVRTIYASLADDGLADRISFGLIAYRDSLEAVPELDYLTQVFADPAAGLDGPAFLAQVESLAAATVSSKGFIEDAFSGVATALSGLKPGDTAGRTFFVLVTDAGARETGDPLSRTGMNAGEIRQLIVESGSAMFVLHLLTEEGRINHQAADTQYRILANHPKAGNLYFPVAAGDVQKFGTRLTEIASVLKSLLSQAQVVGTAQAETPARDQTVAESIAVPAAGQTADLATDLGLKPEIPLESEGSAETERPLAAESAPVPTTAPALGEPLDEGAELQRLRVATQNLGYAMQLAYLGQVEGAAAPTLFEAWASDRDLEAPDTATFDVRVLLTKQQLSDLQAALKSVLEAGRFGQIAPIDFFEQLRTAAAVMARDPSDPALANAQTVADLGLMGELLEDLPYRSKVLTIDQDLWMSFSVGEQDAFLTEIESKVALYEAFHDDADRWILLEPNAAPAEAVYPVPLDALP